MAASIATFTTFTGWQGRLHRAVRRIARLPVRPGVNGEAKVYDGWATNPEPIITRHVATDATDGETDIDTARALMDGDTYTAVDPIGQSFSVKVDRVTGILDQRPAGLSGVVVTLTWTLQVEAEE